MLPALALLAIALIPPIVATLGRRRRPTEAG
jgi:hypothetical protein